MTALPAAMDEPFLADGQVHYIGQPIFLVIAQSHLLARKAARKAVLSYREDTPVLSIEDALSQKNYFEEGPRIYEKGDAVQAISNAEMALEGSFAIGGQEHFYLEGQAALAFPSDDLEMVVHSSTQHPSEVQHKVAHALGLGMHEVRVEVRRMGGGFGGKESQANSPAIACAIAAWATQRPCKMRYDRDDDFMITGKRHDFRIDYSVGFDATGKINGINFPLCALRVVTGSFAAGGRPCDAACRQRLSSGSLPDRKPPVAHEYPKCHSLSWIWGTTGHDRHGAGD